MLKRLPDDLSFEEWIAHLFDHPESETPWYFDVDHEWWHARAQPIVTVDYMTRLFSQGGILLAPFSNTQIAHGLWYLLSNYMMVNEDRDYGVPLARRIECISSILTFFSQVFVPRCSRLYLSWKRKADSETPRRKLEGICYMWWDEFGGYITPQLPGREEINAACLKVIEAILYLDSLPCQESALHGLGHWQRYAPNTVRSAINRYLNWNRNIPPKLRMYALVALEGEVQ